MESNHQPEKIGTLDTFFKKYKVAHSCQFACRILNQRLVDCNGTVGGGYVDGNIVEIPRRTTDTELHVDSEAFNSFGNFPVKLFFSDSSMEPLKALEARLDQLQQAACVVIVQSEVYSVIEGLITLYNPEIKAFSDNFTTLFGQPSEN